MAEYRIMCYNCKKDLTERTVERVGSMVDRIVQFFLSTPGMSRIRVKGRKALITCPSCGYRGEYEIDMNKLAELRLERMK